MADSSLLGSLLVHPGAVAAAEAPVHAIGVSVRQTAGAMPSAGDVHLVGDPVCAQTLLSTCQLVAQAITASGRALDGLAQALGEAATTYRFVDSDAVSWWGW
jgi:hypothetical protein